MDEKAANTLWTIFVSTSLTYFPMSRHFVSFFCFVFVLLFFFLIPWWMGHSSSSVFVFFFCLKKKTKYSNNRHAGKLDSYSTPLIWHKWWAKHYHFVAMKLVPRVLQRKKPEAAKKNMVGRTTWPATKINSENKLCERESYQRHNSHGQLWCVDMVNSEPHPKMSRIHW